MEDEEEISNDTYDVIEDDTPKPVPFAVKVVYGTLGVLVGIWILALLLKNYPDRWIYLQTVILALTFEVVAAYTYLTRKMQQAMVRQTNVSILPSFEVILILEGDIEPESDIGGHAVRSRLELKNVGQGVALNIYIESRLVDCSGRYGAYWYLPVKFEKLYSLSQIKKGKLRILSHTILQRFVRSLILAA